MANTIVSAEQYQEIDKRILEIKRQLNQKGGYPYDPDKLSLTLQAVVEGRFKAVGGKFPCQTLCPDLIPAGYEVIEDVEPSQFQVKDLKLVPFLEDGENYVDGEELRQRAKKLKANLGLADAKFIMDHQNEIPTEFRDKYLVFTGTLLHSLGGELSVAYLSWSRGRWYLSFYWLGHGWFGGDCLVLCK